jgi:hypothetical protein
MSPAKPETDSLRCEVALHLRLASPFQNLQLLQCPPTKNRLLKGNELLTAIWSFETRHKAAALKRPKFAWRNSTGPETTGKVP